jgi:hypothetical protein
MTGVSLLQVTEVCERDHYMTAEQAKTSVAPPIVPRLLMGPWSDLYQKYDVACACPGSGSSTM